MAVIAPFKGILYDQGKTGGLGRVVAPPYDVVSPEEQAAYHQSHPNNVLHIDLGPRLPEDQSAHDWHHRAALTYNRWLAEGILVRDLKPAYYYVETDFTDPQSGQRLTRHGFIGLLRLEEFGASSAVKPHERTFSAHKAERLHLMKHVQANLSQIFTVFPDENLKSREILQAGLRSKPLFDFTDAQGSGHRLWTIHDNGVHRAICDFMKNKTIYIADGHHRYETALNYRRYKAESGVKIGPDSPLNYIMVYFCPVSDPGLSILPAHRLLLSGGPDNLEDFEASLARFFQIQKFSYNVVEERMARQAFIRRLHETGRRHSSIGLFSRLANTYYLLEKKNGAGLKGALGAWPEPLQKLDTVVLTSLVLQEVLGMTDEDLDDADRLAYTSRVNEAINRVRNGGAELAAILNSTPMEQVQAVAEEGLVMPRKSTYFYPKVTTGLVFNPVNPYEAIDPVC